MSNDTSKMIHILKNVFISKLLHLDIIKHGEFKLKNGTTSNIYIDLRKLMNYPSLFIYLDKLITLMYPDLFANSNVKLMPVPLGGIPLSNYLSIMRQIPQVMVRDKIKDYGMQNIIEGVVHNTDTFIMIEDVITSGSSIQALLNNLVANIKVSGQTITKLCQLPFSINAILCICNRSGGNGGTVINSINDIPVYSIFTIDEIEKYITSTTNSTEARLIPQYFKYDSPFANFLYSLALEKHSNIILSCDFMNTDEIVNMINTIGHLIVAVKLHCDLVQNENNITFYKEMYELKNKYGFLIIDDAKYADIETILLDKINNVSPAYEMIMDTLTIHAISGLSVLKNKNIKYSPVIVGEMSCSDNMIDSTYSAKIIDTIRNCGLVFKDNIGGLVCQTGIPKMIEPFEICTMSPGINLECKTDSGNQNYTIPNVRNNKLGLFWIVGRGITQYKDNNYLLLSICEKYVANGWNYFLNY